MKKVVFVLIIFLPVLTFGQENSCIKSDLQQEKELQDYPLYNLAADSERNMEIILIDDRNFSKPLVTFDFDKTYNLSFTEKKKSLFKFNDVEGATEVDPIKSWEWQF